MVNMKKYENLLNEGLSLDHYYVLVMLYNNQKLSSHKRIQGFANTLIKRGYIVEGGLLSEKGIDLAQQEIFEGIVTNSIDITTINPNVTEFNDWAFELHGKLEVKLIELTGKKQVRDRIKNGPLQSFLCNPQDLGTVLKRMMTKYKIKDRVSIENALLKHIENCNKAGNWFPLMQYYIIKDGASKLVTDLAQSNEKEENFSSETLI